MPADRSRHFAVSESPSPDLRPASPPAICYESSSIGSMTVLQEIEGVEARIKKTGGDWENLPDRSEGATSSTSLSVDVRMVDLNVAGLNQAFSDFSRTITEAYSSPDGQLTDLGILKSRLNASKPDTMWASLFSV